MNPRMKKSSVVDWTRKCVVSCKLKVSECNNTASAGGILSDNLIPITDSITRPYYATEFKMDTSLSNSQRAQGNNQDGSVEHHEQETSHIAPRNVSRPSRQDSISFLGGMRY